MAGEGEGEGGLKIFNAPYLGGSNIFQRMGVVSGAHPLRGYNPKHQKKIIHAVLVVINPGIALLTAFFPNFFFIKCR